MHIHFLTKTFNLSITILALVMLLWSSKELFFNPYIPVLSSPTAKIGKINNALNLVKLKKVNLFSWNDANSGMTLNEGDLIFTHQNSESDLIIGKGKKLHIFSESLIEVQGENRLALAKGRASIIFSDGADKLAITLGNKKYTLRSSSAQIEVKHEESKSTISVKTGTLSLIDKSKNEIKLTEHQQLSVGEGKAQISDLRLRPLFPTNTKINTNETSKSVSFEVEIKLKNELPRLQISSESTFKHLIQDVLYIEGREYNLTPGKYWWRLVTPTLQGESAQFEIQRLFAPAPLLSPEENKEIISYTDENVLPIEFANLSMSPFEYAIFNQQGDIVFTQIVDNDSNWSTSLAGDFNIKYRSVKEFVLSSWSRPHSFVLKKFDFKNQKAVVIELRKPNQKVDFHWDSKSDKSYDFILAKDNQFKEIIIRKSLKKANTSFNFPETGVFYWKALARDKNGKPSMLAPTKVIIRPTPPPERPQKLPDLKVILQKTSFIHHFFSFISLAFAEEFGTATLKWPKVEDAKTYEIEIYSSKSLQRKIKTFTTQKNFKNWKVDRPGKFYWRFRYFDYWNRPSPYSEVSSLEILPSIKKDKIKISTIKIRSVKKVKKSQPFYKHHFSFLYAPSYSDYVQKNSNEFKIKGIASTAQAFEYVYQSKTLHQIDFTYQATNGKVFTDQKFLVRYLSSSYSHPFPWAHLGFGVELMSFGHYEVKNNAPNYSKQTETLVPSFQLSKTFWTKNSQSFKAKMQFYALKVSGHELGLTYRFYGPLKVFWPLRLNYKKLEFKEASETKKVSQYQIFVGPELVY